VEFDVAIYNDGEYDIGSWTVSWTLDEGQTLKGFSGPVTVVQNGSSFTATNDNAEDGYIAPTGEQGFAVDFYGPSATPPLACTATELVGARPI
jgi:hypothetical protein